MAFLTDMGALTVEKLTNKEAFERINFLENELNYIKEYKGKDIILKHNDNRLKDYYYILSF